MGFSVQLHVVEDQQLVPGWAKGLIEDLEERERDLLGPWAGAARRLLVSVLLHQGQPRGWVLENEHSPGLSQPRLRLQLQRLAAYVFFGPASHGASPKNFSR